MKYIQEAVAAGCRLPAACQEADLCLRTFRRWVKVGVVCADKRPDAIRPDPVNKLTREEKDAIVAISNAEEYASLPPTQIVPKLADKGIYIASESSFYRVLHAHEQIQRRGRSEYKGKHSAPSSFAATEPNQVWSWDITYCNTHVVDKRSRIGDWEGDTVIGKGHQGALLTLVERKTLYTIIVRLTGKNAGLLAKATIENMLEIKSKVKTITFDNGLEFSEHEKIAKGLGTDIYFAHPYASWERGTNENTNGLIRQYFPKCTNFNDVTDEQVKAVMEKLNDRPRKTRGCRSPNDLFMGHRVDLLAA